MKTERTQIYFLSDVLVAVASLDLKVPISFVRARMCYKAGQPSYLSGGWALMKKPLHRLNWIDSLS